MSVTPYLRLGTDMRVGTSPHFHPTFEPGIANKSFKVTAGGGSAGVEVKAGGSFTFGPGVGSKDVGVIAGIGGELDILKVDIEVVYNAPGETPETCVHVGVGGEAQLTADAKAWFGPFSANASYSIKKGSWAYLAPFYWPTGCDDPSSVPVITTLNLPNATVGRNYATDLTTQDHRVGTWQVSAVPHSPTVLPPGLTLDGHTISGTPTTVGDYPFELTFTDEAGRVATATVTIQVTAPVPACIGPFSGTDVSGSVGLWHWTATDHRATLATYSGTIDWGDGSALVPLGISGGYFEHVFTTPGTYLFRVRDSGTFIGGSPCVSDRAIQIHVS